MLARYYGTMMNLCNEYSYFGDEDLFGLMLRYAGYYLADAVSALLSALAAARLEEPIVTDEQAARERHTLRELPARLRVHILDSADCLRGGCTLRTCAACI